MSRSGYTDDYIDDQWSMICYRGAVASAIRGKRGQAMLRELIAALDAMPEKRLIRQELQLDGQVCTLGALGVARGIDMNGIDPEDYERVSKAFNVPQSLVREIEYENDECGQYNYLAPRPDGKLGFRDETPEERWQRMRSWAEKQLIEWSEVS